MKSISKLLTKMLSPLAAALALLAISGTPATSQAQDDGWSGQISPYVWASGIGGDLTPFSGANTVSFDRSFSEVLDDSDGAFFVTGLARKGRFVILGDFSYFESSRDGVIGPGFPAEGKLKQTSMTLVGGYRAVQQPGITLDVLGGARMWRVQASASVLGGVLQKSAEKTFVDPIIALRTNIALAPRWSAILYADIGGSNSNQTGQFVATVNYKVTDHVYASAGFRTLSMDYSSGGTRVDATMSGALFGLTWRF